MQFFKLKLDFRKLGFVFKWGHYNFIKLALATSLLWTLENNDVLNVSDYVPGQIGDHGRTGEAGVERYLESTTPEATLRLVS